MLSAAPGDGVALLCMDPQSTPTPTPNPTLDPGTPAAALRRVHERADASPPPLAAARSGRRRNVRGARFVTCRIDQEWRRNLRARRGTHVRARVRVRARARVFTSRLIRPNLPNQLYNLHGF